MDKKTLKELFERKDRKRKIALFKVYSAWLFMETSLKFIQDRINHDMGFNLVSEYDIKYIRHHFKRKAQAVPKSFPVMISQIAEDIAPNSQEATLSWTNPDEIGSNQNSLKSKFSK